MRRLKDDLRKITGGFPERRVEQVDIQGLPDDAPELKLVRLLDEYRRGGGRAGLRASRVESKRPQGY